MTDSSLFPFGIHKNKKLIDVPGSYLLHLYNDARQKISEDWPELLLYIEDNLEALKKEK